LWERALWERAQPAKGRQKPAGRIPETPLIGPAVILPGGFATLSRAGSLLQARDYRRLKEKV